MENPFVAAMRLRHLIDGLPASTSSFDDAVGDPALGPLLRKLVPRATWTALSEVRRLRKGVGR